MPNRSSEKGTRTEGVFVRILYAIGFAVLRAPASGGGDDREAPDVLASKFLPEPDEGEAVGFSALFDEGTTFGYAAEVKRSKDDRIYLAEQEIQDLAWFAHHFDVIPTVVCRWDGDTTFYAFHLGDLDCDEDRSEEKRYRAHRSERDRAFRTFHADVIPDDGEEDD